MFLMVMTEKPAILHKFINYLFKSEFWVGPFQIIDFYNMSYL
jgi:hypothetical protein